MVFLQYWPQERQSDKTHDEQMEEVQYWEEGGETVDAVQTGIIQKYLVLIWQEEPPEDD